MPRKKASITVNADEFEEQLRKHFDFVAGAYKVPRGKLLARALFLACTEVQGGRITEQAVGVYREVAKRNGATFDDQVVLPSEEWLKVIPGI